MEKINLFFIVLLLIGLIFPGCLGTGNRNSSLYNHEHNQFESSVPDFKLQDLNNKTISLSDFSGQPVMLNFWATWYAPCRHEMPFIQQVYENW